MAYKMKKHLAHRINYGSNRKTSEIKYIVIHYTAGDGDSDEGNTNYFAKPLERKASAHYFVDDDSITQSVPDDYVAYSVGGSKYTDCAKTGGGKLYQIATNRNTLNIEMCDSIKDGTIKAQEATIINTIKFVRKKMKQYNIDIDHVIRHFDVNGKHCPAYLMNEDDWRIFKDRIIGFQTGTVYHTTRSCVLRSSPGVSDNKVLYKEVNGSVLKKCIRSGQYVRFDGAFKLIDVSIIGNDIWGKMKSGYWIPLKYHGVIRAIK
ncbi:MAG: N-acetylmuramoyl-L-alanine amidase [Lachnospiraceae bacterium]|nr:N-acetylmuramoyl-L-alanine amidase [Lachnospiraceae bacterium]